MVKPDAFTLVHDFSETAGDIDLLNKFRPEEPDGRLDADQASRTGGEQRGSGHAGKGHLPGAKRISWRLREKSASACSICTCRRWAMCGISGRVFSTSASVCSIYACRCRAICGISRGVFSSSGAARSGRRSLITNLVLPLCHRWILPLRADCFRCQVRLGYGFGGSTFNPAAGPWFKRKTTRPIC